MNSKHLLVLLACLFVVMIGFGITLPVLPFYVERLALKAGATPQSIVLHVTLVPPKLNRGTHPHADGRPSTSL